MKHFPLYEWQGIIPVDNHPGSFGFKRKHDIHTGIDLYVSDNEMVIAVESGIVVGVEEYTGPKAGSPWWLPTKAILVEGSLGVVCYGEVLPTGITKGEMVLGGQCLGFVSPVLSPEKIRKDIPNHSNYMLHFELYKTGTKQSVIWDLNKEKPKELLNPTKLLTELYNAVIV